MVAPKPASLDFAQAGAVPLAARPEAFAPTVREGFLLVPRLATHEDAGEGA